VPAPGRLPGPAAEDLDRRRRLKNPYQAVTPPQAALLRQQHYQLSRVKHVPSLTVFLMTRGS
jgi:hypothetical protein